MVNQSRYLVVVDPTQTEQPAVARAAHLATATGARLSLFTCIFNADIAHAEWVSGKNLEHLRAEAIDAQFHELEQMSALLRDGGLDVDIKVAWDRPLHEAIVREALDTGPEFVFKDTHHHSAISRALLTNTDWHLIRECPVPLWLVKPQELGHDITVMAAVDPTHEHDQTAELDGRIIGTLKQLTDALEGNAQLVHIFEPPPPVITGVITPNTTAEHMQEVVDQTRQMHRDALDKLAEDYSIQPDRLQFREGDQVELLPATAGELGANIVIMGAIARSALQRVIVGHTAEKTLEHFTCDVLVVKPEDFTSPVEALPPIVGYTSKTS